MMDSEASKPSAVGREGEDQSWVMSMHLPEGLKLKAGHIQNRRRHGTHSKVNVLVPLFHKRISVVKNLGLAITVTLESMMSSQMPFAIHFCFHISSNSSTHYDQASSCINGKPLLKFDHLDVEIPTLVEYGLRVNQLAAGMLLYEISNFDLPNFNQMPQKSRKPTMKVSENVQAINIKRALTADANRVSTIKFTKPVSKFSCTKKQYQIVLSMRNVD